LYLIALFLESSVISIFIKKSSKWRLSPLCSITSITSRIYTIQF
jgi:hypothetical protein